MCGGAAPAASSERTAASLRSDGATVAPDPGQELTRVFDRGGEHVSRNHSRALSRRLAAHVLAVIGTGALTVFAIVVDLLPSRFLWQHGVFALVMAGIAMVIADLVGDEFDALHWNLVAIRTAIGQRSPRVTYSDKAPAAPWCPGLVSALEMSLELDGRLILDRFALAVEATSEGGGLPRDGARSVELRDGVGRFRPVVAPVAAPWAPDSWWIAVRGVVDGTPTVLVGVVEGRDDIDVTALHRADAPAAEQWAAAAWSAVAGRRHLPAEAEFRAEPATYHFRVIVEAAGLTTADAQRVGQNVQAWLDGLLLPVRVEARGRGDRQWARDAGGTTSER